MKSARPRVVVVGAGFAGLTTAQALAQCPVEVWLLDRNNYHVFLPLLYQVAAAELEPESIAYPVRSTLRRQRNARFALADVQRVDFAARRVETSAHSFDYDFLVLATGSETHFFGVTGAMDFAFGLKSLNDAIALRNQILCCFETAAREPDTELRRRRLTFVIVGGGPTGVEFAGALAELIAGPLEKDFPEVNRHDVRIVVLEARDGLLPGWPARLTDYALRRLTGMGVEVLVNAAVNEVATDAVHLRDGRAIPTDTVVWTAGVRGDPAASTWGLPVKRNGRVEVLPTLQLVAHLETYVIGDLAQVKSAQPPLPMIAPVALQQGQAVARNIARQVAGESPLPFRYRDRGTMVTIGRNAAVAQIGSVAMTGWPAWLLWLGVHLIKLIGFRNRLLVLINWTWDYLFFEHAVRLILPAGRGQTARTRERELGVCAND